VSSDPRVVEVYLGTDAGATQAAAATSAALEQDSEKIMPNKRRAHAGDEIGGRGYGTFQALFASASTQSGEAVGVIGPNVPARPP